MEFCELFVYFGDLPDLVLQLISVVLSMDDSPDPCPLVIFGFIWRYFFFHIWAEEAGEWYRYLVREASDAAKHPTALRTIPHPKELSHPKYM